MSEAATVLEFRDLTIQFGGLRANDSVSFAVPRGAFFGLIGPNGAGKTTLFNAMTGIVTPTSGDILFCGKSLLLKCPFTLRHLRATQRQQRYVLTTILVRKYAPPPRNVLGRSDHIHY